MRAILFLIFPIILCSYTSVQVPNGETLKWEKDGDVKVFHLEAGWAEREFAKGLTIRCFGYNGMTPGPVIEAEEGDTVRIVVTNHLPEPTTVHWHGIRLPYLMDGVTGLTQTPIQPGESFTYEFTLKQSGTYMYHAHYDEMVQQAMGLVGFFIIHPKKDTSKVDKDFAIFLQEWAIPAGAFMPDPMSLDFNYFTFNGVVWPKAKPLQVRLGEKVRIRLGNLSMNSHPIHLHGFLFTVAAMGGEPLPESARYNTVTINVPPGETRDIEFIADAEGDWALHCHKSHHIMNGMSHSVSNSLGSDQSASAAILKSFLPGYMPMGTTGMGHMYEKQHGALPPYFLPYGSKGPFGTIEMSGMFTVVQVRKDLEATPDER